MNKYKKIWIISSVFILALFSGLYAAWTQISSLSQSVWDWDIITSAYYNALWTLLWGSKSEWKFCKFTWWKILCIDNALWGWSSSSSSSSSSSWGQPTPTPMQKISFHSPNFPSTNAAQDKENADAWNALVWEVETKWIELYGADSDFMRAEWRWVPGWWMDTCIMKYDTINIADTSVYTRQWCASIICGRKTWTNWVSEASFCWVWWSSCGRGQWDLTCMY